MPTVQDPNSTLNIGQPKAPNDATGWYNATSYGGNANGANAATDRFQGLGQAAAQRQAYNQNYAGYQSLMDQANNSGRGGQADALALQRSAALGQQPSQAQLLGQNMMDQSINAQMATAASARGGSLAQAAAMQHAANQGDAYRQQGTNALMAQRAAEMADARGQYMQGATAMRSGDFQGAGLELGRDAQQIQNEQFQRGLNQQGQMGYEQMGQNAQTAQMQSQGQQAALASQNWQQQVNTDQHAQDRSTGVIGSVVGGIAGGVAGLFSDVRSKTDVQPLMPPTDSNAAEAAKIRAQFDTTPVIADDGSVSYQPTSIGAAAQMQHDESQKPSAFARFFQGAFGAPGQGRPGGFQMYSDPMTKTNISQPGGTSMLGHGGGMDVMGSLKANSDFATSFMKQGGSQTGGMMLSDDRAKLAQAWDEGQSSAIQSMQQLGAMSPQELKQHDSQLANAVRQMRGDAWQEGHAAPNVPSRPTMPLHDPRYRLPTPPSAAPMADANRALAPSAYEYKPEYTPPDQQPGEKNVGPMAQNMAADPVAATAVHRDPRSGLLAIDRDKALKLSLGGVGALQQQQDETNRRLTSLSAAVARQREARR